MHFNKTQKYMYVPFRLVRQQRRIRIKKRKRRKKLNPCRCLSLIWWVCIDFSIWFYFHRFVWRWEKWYLTKRYLSSHIIPAHSERKRERERESKKHLEKLSKYLVPFRTKIKKIFCSSFSRDVCMRNQPQQR